MSGWRRFAALLRAKLGSLAKRQAEDLQERRRRRRVTRRAVNAKRARVETIEEAQECLRWIAENAAAEKEKTSRGIAQDYDSST